MFPKMCLLESSDMAASWMDDPHLTAHINAWMQGSSEADKDALTMKVYTTLRDISRRAQRDTPQTEMQPTEVVHEALAHLLKSQEVTFESRNHFFGVASRAMRHIIIQAWRESKAEKRGGHHDSPITLNEELVSSEDLSPPTWPQFEEALQTLEHLDSKLAHIVELRVYGGLEHAEIAAVMEVSPPTVRRMWKVAKVMLRHQLRPRQGEGPE